MSTKSPSIFTSLSDINKNPKLNYYDPHLCKDIHIQLDREAREQGLSYEQRFEMAKKNLTVFEKWSSIFPLGISQCLYEYWKERVSSPPFDPRFPNVNQTKRCWVNYVDYHRCMEKKNDEKICGYFKHLYKDLCPAEWVDKWDDQVERELFPGIHQ